MASIYIINTVLEKIAPGLFKNAKNNTHIVLASVTKIFYENIMISSEIFVVSGLIGAVIWMKKKRNSNNVLNDVHQTDKKYEKALGFLLNSFSFVWLIPIFRTVQSIKNKNIKILNFL